MRVYRGPHNSIIEVSHAKHLKEHIREKMKLDESMFNTMNWSGMESYMETTIIVRQTNVVKMLHDWVNEGQQQDLFLNDKEVTQYPAECGRVDHHKHYTS